MKLLQLQEVRTHCEFLYTCINVNALITEGDEPPTELPTVTAETSTTNATTNAATGFQG